MENPSAPLHVCHKYLTFAQRLTSPKFMPTTLRHNLTSAYLDAARKLADAARKLAPRKRRRRIVAYVESYDDVAFWRTLLSEFEDDTRYFQVMLPSSTSLAKGKKMVLMNTLNTEKLGHSLIACVDSDYDFLLQGATHTSRKVNDNPYIFQTYGYAIESFQCYAEASSATPKACTKSASRPR